MDMQESKRRLENLYEHFAEVASEDESVADDILRARNLDPDEVGSSLVRTVRRRVALAKADHERNVRGASAPDVEEHFHDMLEKFGSAVEALQYGLGDKQLSMQYRNLNSEPTEEEAQEILKEEIKLRLSGNEIEPE